MLECGDRNDEDGLLGYCIHLCFFIKSLDSVRILIAHRTVNFHFPPSRNVVVDCGRLQMALANEVVEHEARVEEKVVTLLHTVSEGEVPNIQKLKRNLAKLILDMDSARTRYWF